MHASMKRVLPLLLLALALFARAADPVEASAGIRESLRKAKELTIHEALPSPLVYPDLAEQEAKRPDIGKIEGHVFYTPGVVAKDPALLQALLTNPDHLEGETGKGLRGDDPFYPEYAISWNDNGKRSIVMVSAWSQEVIFIRANARSTHFLKPEILVTSWKIAESLRNKAPEDKPDEISATDGFRKSLLAGGKIEFHAGLPARHDAGFKKESEREDIFDVGGQLFYRTAIPLKDEEATRKLFGSPAILAPWSGVKRCGGFHADYAVSWSHQGKPVHLMVCFGCGEIRVQLEDRNFLYNIAPGEMEEALKKVQTRHLDQRR